MKVLGRELNPYHSSNLSHCSDNARSLTRCTTRELQDLNLFKQFDKDDCIDFVFFRAALVEAGRATAGACATATVMLDP